jgi:hypothetical protein
MASVPNELLIELRNVFRERFNLSDLSDLCQELGIDIENLPGTSRNEKARELAAYLGRRDMVGKLAEVGPKSWPDVPWLEILGRYGYAAAPVSTTTSHEVSHPDLQKLAPVLAAAPGFLSAGNRHGFLAVAGVDRLINVNLEGAPLNVAREVLTALNRYGRTTDGDIALGRLLSSLRDDETMSPSSKDVVNEIIARYQLV